MVRILVGLLLVGCALLCAEAQESTLWRLVQFAQNNPHSVGDANSIFQTQYAIEEYQNLDDDIRALIDDTLDQTLTQYKEKLQGNKTRARSDVRLSSEDFFDNLHEGVPLPEAKVPRFKRSVRASTIPLGAALHTWPTDFAVTDLTFPTDGKNFMSQPIIPYHISGLSGGASKCSSLEWPSLQDSGRVLGLWKELQEIFQNVIQICDILPESYGARRICLGVVEFVSAFVTAVAEYRYRHMLTCRNVLDYASTKSLLDNTIAVHKQVLLMRRLQLEDLLSDGNIPASLALPQSQGGQFEALCYAAYDAFSTAQYYKLMTTEQEATAQLQLDRVTGSVPYISNTVKLQEAYNTLSMLEVEGESNFPEPVIEADLTAPRTQFRSKCFFPGPVPSLGRDD